MATFYLVSTPIGNLKDITLRAIEVLNTVDIILCEDTRETQKILQSYPSQESNKPKLLSYNDHNRDMRIPQVISFLQSGQNVALATDRGTPLISDPGYKLMQQVIQLSENDPNIQIDTVPGANAVLPALQLSGLPPDKFYFVGFLPKKGGQRQKLLSDLRPTTIIAYESPHRLIDSLQDMKLILGSKTQTAVCFELTKIHQRVIRGDIESVLNELSDKPVKGEIVIVFRKQ